MFREIATIDSIAIASIPSSSPTTLSIQDGLESLVDRGPDSRQTAPCAGYYYYCRRLVYVSVPLFIAQRLRDERAEKIRRAKSHQPHMTGRSSLKI